MKECGTQRNWLALLEASASRIPLTETTKSQPRRTRKSEGLCARGVRIDESLLSASRRVCHCKLSIEHKLSTRRKPLSLAKRNDGRETNTCNQLMGHEQFSMVYCEKFTMFEACRWLFSLIWTTVLTIDGCRNSDCSNIIIISPRLFFRT